MNQSQAKSLIQKNQQDLIKFLGLSALPKEKQEKIMARLQEIIFRQIIIEVVDHLSEEEVKELNKITQKNNLAQVFDYLDDKVDNFEEFLQKVAYKVLGRFKHLAGRNKESS